MTTTTAMRILRRSSPRRGLRSKHPLFWCLTACGVVLLTAPQIVNAVLTKGTTQQLVAGETNQGGGATSSSKFRQQLSIGEAVTGVRIVSSRFHIIPGFLGATSSTGPTIPVDDLLTIKVLYAKASPFGAEILPKTWQQSRNPVFFWQVPEPGLELAGYSYAIDGDPDNKVDTTLTTFNVATSPLAMLPDGKHIFSVKAINTAGNAGKPTSFEFWVDTTAPQVTTYAPSPGTLLNTLNPTVSATISDLGSGVTNSTIQLLINGSSIPVQFNEQTGAMSATGGTWRDGANNLELRVTDAVGNTQAPLVWSVTVDTKPPTGTVTINGGADLTTSVYVTLGFSATDATSGVTRVLISNEELASYVDEPYVASRALWKLIPIRGSQKVYVKFADKAGNVSAPVSASIELALLAPETVITSGPAGFAPPQSTTFTFMCPEGDCVFSYAFDNDDWSPWSAVATATKANLSFGNHYFRVKAAKEVNGIPDIQPDEEDPSPAERTWVVGVEPSILTVPKGPPIRVWRIE